MELTFAAEAPPLYADDDGAVRVAGTRFLLEIFWRIYLSGMPPEQIAEEYDTLDLPAIHSAIGFCLRHRAAVDAYVARRDAEAEQVRRMVEARQGPQPTRAELLARLAAKQGR